MQERKLKETKRRHLGKLPKEVCDLPYKSVSDAIRIIHDGISTTKTDIFFKELDIPQTLGASLLGISQRTLARRFASDKKHTLEEGNRFYRLSQITCAALELFGGNLESARRWLNTPLPVLGEATPFEYCETEPGTQFVQDLIGRLKHGVFS